MASSRHALQTETPMIDQRRFERTTIEAPIVVRGAASTRTLLRGHCMNLSEGGAGGILSGDLLPGQVVLMELVLSTERAVQVNARVRHRARLYCGFEFLGPDGAVLGQIREACAKQDSELRAQ